MSNDELTKARGVPTMAGPAPGPPPSPGLVWESTSHRWTRPEEAGELQQTSLGELKKQFDATGEFIKNDGVYKVYRVGSVADASRGIFFAGSKEDADLYSVLHQGRTVREFMISLPRVLVVGHQNDVCKKFFHKTYADIVDYHARKTHSETEGGRQLDIMIRNKAKRLGFDGIIYTKPAPPAQTELMVVNKEHALGKDLEKGNTDGQGDRFRVTPDTDDAEDKPVVRAAFDNVVEFEGRKYVELGNTFRTDIDVEPGAVIEVNAQELVMSQNRLSWDKPRVSGVDLTRATPYTLSTTLSIAQRYENTIIKSEKRSASQDDLDEPAEGGRDKFDVKVGDSGVLTIDEHITFLDEDAAREFIGVTSYEGWNSTKQRFSRRVGAVHSDVRILNHGSDFLQGFVAAIGGMKDRNKLVDNQNGDRVLVSSFKAPTTHGKTKWQSEVGIKKPWLFEPGEIGSPSQRWSVVFKVERKARVIFGRVDERFIEMRVSGTKYMPEGRWILMLAPIEPNHTEWILVRPKNQKFGDASLNEVLKSTKRTSLLKAVLGNRDV